MRLIEQRGQLTEDHAGLGHPGDLGAILDDTDHTAFENERLPGSRPFAEHRLAGAVAGEWKRGKPRLPSLGVVELRHCSHPSLPNPGEDYSYEKSLEHKRRGALRVVALFGMPTPQPRLPTAVTARLVL